MSAPWEQTPGVRGRNPVSVVRLPAGASWTLVATATKLMQVNTHFADGRTGPCLRDWGGDCKLCEKDAERRFLAYLGAHHPRDGMDLVVVLPRLAFERLDALLPGVLAAGGLRGTWLTLTREGARRSELAVSLAEAPAGFRTPPGRDVPEIVCRAWNASGILWRYRNRPPDQAAAV